MTLQQLKYVIALDDYRHFVTAAEKCFVSQPTLTLQIKKLETELGVALFDRSKHPIEPTPMGERLILKARQILHDVDEFNSLVSDDKKKTERRIPNWDYSDSGTLSSPLVSRRFY